MNDIQLGRKIIRDAFDKDEELKKGYCDNIAMFLYDHCGVRNYDKRNQAAKDILKLIFYN